MIKHSVHFVVELNALLSPSLEKIILQLVLLGIDPAAVAFTGKYRDAVS